MKSSLFILGSMMAASVFVSCGNSGNSNNSNEDSTNALEDSSTVSTDNLAPEGTLVATANLISTSDSTQTLGTAKFYQLDSTQIRLDIEINDQARADSNVAVHFHEHGDCGNKGDNTHGHWNPTKQKHGEWGSAAYHLGDIGNIMLDQNGHGTKSVTTDKWSLKEGDANYFIGLGLIVHGGTDDYTTQPTGNSGPRIGCGVITRQ